MTIEEAKKIIFPCICIRLNYSFYTNNIKIGDELKIIRNEYDTGLVDSNGYIHSIYNLKLKTT